MVRTWIRPSMIKSNIFLPTPPLQHTRTGDNYDDNDNDGGDMGGDSIDRTRFNLTEYDVGRTAALDSQGQLDLLEAPRMVEKVAMMSYV